MTWLARVSVLVALSLGAPAWVEAQGAASAEDEARGYFAQGRTAYEAGNFEEAGRAFRRAYLLSGRGELLYNVGQAELRLGHDALALEAFEGYLRSEPDDAERQRETTERVRVLRSMGVAPASEAEVRAATQRAERAAGSTNGSDSGGSGVDPAPWIVVGIGGAAVIAGAVLLGVASSEASRVTNAPAGSTWAELQGIAAGADAMWIAGWVTLGVGAAAVVGGLTWALVGGSDGEAQTSLRIGPGGLALTGTF